LGPLLGAIVCGEHEFEVKITKFNNGREIIHFKKLSLFSPSYCQIISIKNLIFFFRFS
jgi:hypothetical protein